MNTATPTPRIEIYVVGSRGYYRARCPALGLYREHRTRNGAVSRLKMAIAASKAEQS